MRNTAFMYLALKRANIPVELHIFANGNHDLGEGQKLSCVLDESCVNWLRSHDLLTPTAGK